MSEPNLTTAQQATLVKPQDHLQPHPKWLTVLPLQEAVLFPQLVMPVTYSSNVPTAAIQQAIRAEKPIGLMLQANSDEGENDKNDKTSNNSTAKPYSVGTAANVLRYVTGNDGEHHMICQGIARFRVRKFDKDADNVTTAHVEWIDEPEPERNRDIDARMHNLRERALEALQLLPQVPEGLNQAIRSIDSAPLLADAVTSYLALKPSQQQQILETIELIPRLEKVQSFLDYRLDVLRLSRDISQQTEERMSERQREAMLREQMHSIQSELGDDDNRSQEIKTLRDTLDKAELPPEACEQTDRELKRLEHIPEASPEYSMVRTYLDWMAELPWSKQTEDKLDIEAARTVLDEDHYGLDKVKRRILEHLAVHQLNPEGKSPILCFVGPPGVGKTSLGQSIARAMDRRFVRASLGGVHDESEIRGHRRTYIGALPGNIIEHLRKVGTRNPVFMLDEMDKLSASFHGDPAAALLEVLDPEQNDTFRDNYLGVPFDLTRVMFIGTANVLESIPGQLRDRMEVIELSGYTRDEKVQIARRYLISRQIERAGLTKSQCTISDDALYSLIADYTREAGVRNLEREIGAVARHVAMRVAEGKTGPHQIDADDLSEILGSRRFENETALRTNVPGVSTGLAWTPAGGEILFIEAGRAPGKGRLTLTGQLGDVMKESAQAALTLVKSRAGDLGIDSDEFEKYDIHMHIPAGAIPKDGPSAGIALYTALVSLLTGRTVRPDVAMTGEISLRGQVLPIGGVKEKTLAAHQAGIKTVLLPERNRKDEQDIPDNIRNDLHIEWIEKVDDAVQVALRAESKSTAPV